MRPAHERVRWFLAVELLPSRKERTRATQDTSKLKRWSIDFMRFARLKENDMRNDRNIKKLSSLTFTKSVRCAGHGRQKTETKFPLVGFSSNNDVEAAGARWGK